MHLATTMWLINPCTSTIWQKSSNNPSKPIICQLSPNLCFWRRVAGFWWAISYYSKAEFQSDLDLIWSNCRQYNIDPVIYSLPLESHIHSSRSKTLLQSSIYRVKANILEAKANELMASVPDVDLSHMRADGLVARYVRCFLCIHKRWIFWLRAMDQALKGTR